MEETGRKNRAEQGVGKLCVPWINVLRKQFAVGISSEFFGLIYGPPSTFYYMSYYMIN